MVIKKNTIGPCLGGQRRPGAPVAGGLIARCDGFADPTHTIRAFKVTADSLGAVFHEHCRAVDIEQRAGAWPDGVAAWLGEPLPLQTVGLMMFVAARVARLIDLVAGFANCMLSIKQIEEERCWSVAGCARGPTATAVPRASTSPPWPPGSHGGTASPPTHLRDAPVMRCWSGIEGFTPDGLPASGFQLGLVAILDKLRQIFSALARVSAYATSKNLLEKSSDDLAELRMRGVNLIYLGVELGATAVLKRILKGATQESMPRALERARGAGLKVSAAIILGLGGGAGCEEHIVGKAELINRQPSTYLSTLKLALDDSVASECLAAPDDEFKL